MNTETKKSINDDNSNTFWGFWQNPRIQAGLLAFMYSSYFFKGQEAIIYIIASISSLLLAYSIVDGLIREIKKD